MGVFALNGVLSKTATAVATDFFVCVQSILLPVSRDRSHSEPLLPRRINGGRFSFRMRQHICIPRYAVFNSFFWREWNATDWKVFPLSFLFVPLLMLFLFSVCFRFILIQTEQKMYEAWRNEVTGFWFCRRPLFPCVFHPPEWHTHQPRAPNLRRCRLGTQWIRRQAVQIGRYSAIVTWNVRRGTRALWLLGAVRLATPLPFLAARYVWSAFFVFKVRI